MLLNNSINNLYPSTDKSHDHYITVFELYKHQDRLFFIKAQEVLNNGSGDGYTLSKEYKTYHTCPMEGWVENDVVALLKILNLTPRKQQTHISDYVAQEQGILGITDRVYVDEKGKIIDPKKHDSNKPCKIILQQRLISLKSISNPFDDVEPDRLYGYEEPVYYHVSSWDYTEQLRYSSSKEELPSWFEDAENYDFARCRKLWMAVCKDEVCLFYPRSPFLTNLGIKNPDIDDFETPSNIINVLEHVYTDEYDGQTNKESKLQLILQPKKINLDKVILLKPVYQLTTKDKIYLDVNGIDIKSLLLPVFNVKELREELKDRS